MHPVRQRGPAADEVTDAVHPPGHGAVHVPHGSDDQVFGVVGSQGRGVQDSRIVRSHSAQVFTEFAHAVNGARRNRLRLCGVVSADVLDALGLGRLRGGRASAAA